MKRLPSMLEIGHQLRQRRPSRASRSRSCRRSTTRWAACRPTSTARSSRRRTAIRTRSSTASTRSASARASACTAPTGSAPIRCSTCWSSAAPPATTSSRSARSRAHRKPLPARCRRLHARAPRAPRRAAPAASTRRTSPTTCARPCRRTAACSAPRRCWTRASARCSELAERARSMHQADKSKIFNTARVEALELDNLIESAQATMVSAAARHECRGAHTVRLRAAARRSGDPHGRDDADG